VFEISPAVSALRQSRVRAALTAVAIAAAIVAPTRGFASLGADTSAPAIERFQNVDYLSYDQGTALDLGFTVLVPSWIPSPFGGSPSVDASGGYYSLYWMNDGGDPTFLQVEGVVGGGLPAGSPYDLNVQLSINASVNGIGAIHDVTPIYDAVWWIQGGVLYKVESRNSGTDSLSLASSLIAFEPPAATEPDPQPTDVPEPEPTQVPDDNGQPVDNSGGDGEPSVSEPVATDQPTDTPAQPVPDQSTEQPTTDEPTVQDQSTSQEVPSSDSTTSDSGGDGTTAPTPVPVKTDGTGESSVNSDGTGGANVPAYGGDGTGGTLDVVVTIPRTDGPSPAP